MGIPGGRLTNAERTVSESIRGRYGRTKEIPAIAAGTFSSAPVTRVTAVDHVGWTVSGTE